MIPLRDLGLVEKEIHDKTRRKLISITEKKETCKRLAPFSQHVELMHSKVRSAKDKKEYNQECPKCKKCFKYNFSRDSHVEMCTSSNKEERPNHVEPGSFDCEQCGKVFRHKVSLERHIQTHSKGEGFNCERCDASFSRKDNLLKHEKRVHYLGNLNVGLIRKDTSTSTKYECKICGRKFGSDKAKYEAHLMLRLCQQKEAVDIDDD